MNIVTAKISSYECERPLPAANWYVGDLLACHQHPLMLGTSLVFYKKSTFIKYKVCKRTIKLCCSCFSDYTVVIFFMLTPLWIFNMLHSVKQVDNTRVYDYYGLCMKMDMHNYSMVNFIIERLKLCLL